MLKASNCVSNVFGIDRDAYLHALKSSLPKIVPNGLPTSEDLDAVAEEERIKNATSVNNTE